MKEKGKFGIISGIFILTCVIVLLITDKIKSEDEVYIKPVSVSESISVSLTQAGEIIQTDDSNNEKININTADAEELTRLPGIGDVIAGRIIEYREKQGKFNAIEEITEVSGIGETKFSQIKDMITV